VNSRQPPFVDIKKHRKSGIRLKKTEKYSTLSKKYAQSDI
jgi:hypothetical protein